MRIVKVECFGLEATLDRPFGFSQGWVTTRRAVLVRVETADGLEGWGEAFCLVPPKIYTTLISELLAPELLGTNPWDREVLWQRLYNATIDCGQRGLVVGALSALDIALWDLVGLHCGQPVHRLLGGLARREMTAYATGLYRQPSDQWAAALEEEARSYVEAGFRTMKMKIGFGVRNDEAAVRAVRAAIGTEIALAVDANHAYTARQAVTLGRLLEPYDIAWFEEPVSPEDIAGYAEVRARQQLPVAGGELSYTRVGFRELLERRAVDILQPDIGLCGGLSEARAVADLARAFATPCWAHVWGTGVAQLAALHFLGSLPTASAVEDVSAPLLEWDRSENPLRDHVVANTPVAKCGAVPVPLDPGLGVVIDYAALARFQVAHGVVSSTMVPA